MNSALVGCVEAETTDRKSSRVVCGLQLLALETELRPGVVVYCSAVLVGT